MKQYIFIISVLSCFVFSTAAFAQALVIPNDEIYRQGVIQESIQDYLRNVGPCPCPYNIAHDGRWCGDFSAWSRRGGNAPVCFPEEVRLPNDFSTRHGRPQPIMVHQAGAGH